MTLKEAEQDARFNDFKIMGMLELIMYIAKCRRYLSNKEDAEVREYFEAAKLIKDSRTGVE